MTEQQDESSPELTEAVSLEAENENETIAETSSFSWIREIRGLLAILFVFGGLLLYMSHFPGQPSWTYWARIALLAILAVPIRGSFGGYIQSNIRRFELCLLERVGLD